MRLSPLGRGGDVPGVCVGPFRVGAPRIPQNGTSDGAPGIRTAAPILRGLRNRGDRHSVIPFVQTRRSAWTLVCAVALVIAVLSLVPKPEDILPVTLWDKLSHFLAYGSLAFALAHALALSGRTGPSRVAMGVALATGYGALIEGLQFFAPPREPELLDILGNFLGSCAGTAAFVVMHLADAKRRPAAGIEAERATDA